MFYSASTILSKSGRVAPVVSGGSLPTYISNASTLTWTAISGTTGTTAMAGYSSPAGSKIYICSYSGGAWDETGKRFFLFGGGHNDYGGNEILIYNLGLNSPNISIPYNPSTPTYEASYYADGKPCSRHSYSGVHFYSDENKFIAIGGARYGAGQFINNVDIYDVAGNSWSAQGTYPTDSAVDGNDCPCAMDSNGDIWYQTLGGAGTIVKFLKSSKTWSSLGSKTPPSGTSCTFVWDKARSRMIRLGSNREWDISGNESAVSFTGAQSAQATAGRSAVYCDERNSILIQAWGSSTIYEAVWNGSSYATTTLSISGTAPGQASDAVNNLHGRLFYSAEYKTLYMIAEADANCYFVRMA